MNVEKHFCAHLNCNMIVQCIQYTDSFRVVYVIYCPDIKTALRNEKCSVEPGSVGMCQSSNPNSSVVIIPQFQANCYSIISMYTFAKNVQI